MLKISFCLTLCLIFSLKAYAQEAIDLEDPARHVAVIVAAHRYEVSGRQMHEIVGTLLRAKQDFTANPAGYRIYDFDTGEVRQMKVDEWVMSEYSRLAGEHVIDTDLTRLQRTSEVISLFPGGDYISDPLDLAIKHWPAGTPPLSSESEFTILDEGRVIWEMSQDTGAIGKIIRDEFQKKYGKDIREYLGRTEENVNARRAAETGALGTTIDRRFDEAMAEINRLERNNSDFQNLYLTHRADAERTAQRKEEAAQLRAEVMGGFGVLEGAAVLMGDAETARKVSQMSQLAETGLNIASGDLQGLALANQYVAAAVIMSKILASGGPSAEEQMMDKLKEIMDLLIKTRREMHARFEMVDDKLDTLLNELEIGIKSLQNSSERMEDRLARIKDALENHQQETALQFAAVYDRFHAEEISLCLNRDFRPNVHLTRGQFDDCLRRIKDNVFDYSRFWFDPVSPDIKDLALSSVESFELPFASSIGALINTLRNKYDQRLASEKDARNPARWHRHVQDLMRLWTTHSPLTNIAGNQEIQLAIDAGRKIQDVYASLALRPGNSGELSVNLPLFEQVLNDYQEQVADALISIETVAKQNRYGAHPGLSPDQEIPRDSSWNIVNDRMALCAGEGTFGVKQVTLNVNGTVVAQQNWGSNAHLKYMKSLRPSLDYPIWSSAYYSMPNGLLWLDRMAPGAVKICIREFVFDEWTHYVDATTADIKIILNAVVDGRIAAEGKVNLTIEHPFNPKQYGHDVILQMYDDYWSGVDFAGVTSGGYYLPSMQFDGISTKDFSGIGEWKMLETDFIHGIVQDGIGMPEGQDPIPGLTGLKNQALQQIFHDDENFNDKASAITAVRNVLHMLLELGISDTVPERPILQAMVYSATLEAQGLRNLETMALQIVDGKFTKEQIMEQITRTRADFMSKLRSMNESGIPLRPVNLTIERTIYQLERLVRPEVVLPTPAE